VNGATGEPWIEVYRSSRRRDAEEHALVLAAVGIGCTVQPLDGVVTLLVPTSEALRARQQLVQYARENHKHEVEEQHGQKHHTQHHIRRFIDGLPAAVGCAGVLVLLHAWSRQGTFFQNWLSAGAAQARLILGGEWWRTMTALGLHADLGHLASNVIFGIVFGLLVAQIFGSGLGWLVILLAGTAGNALNALVQPETHTAIGASTAVFAAIGILSGVMWRRKRYALGLRRWTPLAGGLMLLVYLGIGGERTDIGSHAAGFATGVLSGMVLAQVHDRLPQGAPPQRAFGAAAMLLFVLAWVLALRAHA
jgi:membrane associated rhomboid family serine protease